MIFIFNYEREEMLNQILNQLRSEKPVVLDDGSSYFIDYDNVIRFAHGGKQEFWRKWFVAFELAKGSEDDFFMFMPNDFLDLDLTKIKKIHKKLKDNPYVYNIINDGRDTCWNSQPPRPFDQSADQVFFTDCGFFCNRKALDAIGWKITPIDGRRFVKRSDISSGVGQQLTSEFNRHRVKMFRPRKSLAKHGDHPSVMHPELRQTIKLISK